jgi:hypothetical protein
MLQILEGAAVIAAMSLYLIPSIEADARDHKDAFAITVVNILLGWTVVGWFAARAWAHNRHESRLLPRSLIRTRRAAGFVTSHKLVQHAKLGTALERSGKTRQRGVTGLC